MITAVLDACVLYPPTLRDLLMRLAGGILYAPRFTDAIHDEWMRNVLQDRPDLMPAQLQRTRQFMNEVDADALVTGYESLVPSLSLPDQNDRHVLAAAVHCKASVIVTFNLRDFPASVLSPLAITAQTPDLFVCALYDANPNAVVERLRRQRTALRNPAKSPERFVDSLRANRLNGFADRLTLRLDEV